MKAINPHAGESGDEQEMRQGFPCVLLVYPPSFRMGKSYPEVIPSIPPSARVLTLVCRWIYWGTSSYEEPCSISAVKRDTRLIWLVSAPGGFLFKAEQRLDDTIL